MMSSSRRAAASLQRLVVEIYFSGSLQKAWQSDPEAVRRRYRVPKRWSAFVPRISSPAFQAESWGRRLLIAREIFQRFPRSVKALTAVGTAEEFARSEICLSFLDSPWFFKAGGGMDHPYGIGPGYDNVSKFARWAVHCLSAEQCTLRPASPAARDRVMATVYEEFALHLMSIAHHSRVPWLRRLKSGIYFRPRATARRKRIVVVTSDFEVMSLSVEAEPILKAERLTDMDAIFSSPAARGGMERIGRGD